MGWRVSSKVGEGSKAGSPKNPTATIPPPA